jgi:phytoene dehydrogenase-like protein
MRAIEVATPIGGFYLCGSGTHPGGGVMGSPGYLAAKRILSGERKR